MHRPTLWAPLFAWLAVGTLAGGGFAQPAAPPSQSEGSAGSLFAPIDRQLLDLDTRLEAIERQYKAVSSGKQGAQPRDLGPDCLPKATPAHMARNFQDLSQDPSTTKLNEVFAGQLADYFECAALATGNPTVCEQAGEAFDKRDHFYPKVKAHCEFQVSRLTLFAQLVRGSPDFQARCLRDLPFDFPGAGKSKACHILATEWRDPARACADIHESLKSETSDPQFDVQFCLPQLQSINGDSSVCDGLTSPKDKQSCQTIAAYSRAYRARNASQCAGDLRCREMMQANVGYCVGFARQAAKSYCQINETLARERWSDSRNAVQELSVAFQQFGVIQSAASEQIRTELENIDARLRPQDRELAVQVDDRYDRLASIETRAERLAPKFLIRPPSGQ